MTDDPYVIWSFEHCAWWGPGRWGYTDKLADAGRYTQTEAEAICAQANLVTFNEVPLPLRLLEGVEHPFQLATDECRVCGRWLGFGCRFLHVGLCETCRDAPAH